MDVSKSYHVTSLTSSTNKTKITQQGKQQRQKKGRRGRLIRNARDRRNDYGFSYLDSSVAFGSTFVSTWPTDPALRPRDVSNPTGNYAALCMPNLTAQSSPV